MSSSTFKSTIDYRENVRRKHGDIIGVANWGGQGSLLLILVCTSRVQYTLIEQSFVLTEKCQCIKFTSELILFYKVKNSKSPVGGIPPDPLY